MKEYVNTAKMQGYKPYFNKPTHELTYSELVIEYDCAKNWMNEEGRDLTLNQMISNLQHHLKENHHPHTELVVTESSYDVKVTILHSNLSVYDNE